MKTKPLLIALALALTGALHAQRQTIGVGASANDGTGDTLREAGIKINANFAELYGGGYVYAMPALELNMTAANTKTLAASSTVTFGTAPTKVLQPSSITVTNTDAGAITITLPANVVDSVSGETVSIFTVPGNGRRTVGFRWLTGTTYEIVWKGFRGDVTAAAAFGNDNRLLRSDGTGKGSQASGITVSDGNDVSGIGDLTADQVTVATDVAYGPGWNGALELPSQNAVYDQMELRAPKASPSFTGTVTNGGNVVNTQAAMASTAVDTSKLYQLRAIGGNETWTWGVAPATAGQEWGVEASNATGALRTITIPTSIDGNDPAGAVLPTFTIPSGGRRTIVWRYNGTSSIVFISGPGEDSGGGGSLPDSYTGAGTYAYGYTYSGILDADEEVDFSGGAAGLWQHYMLNVQGAVRRFTFPTSYRVGDQSGTIDYLDLPIGVCMISFYDDGTSTFVVPTYMELLPLTTGVTGVLPVANGGTNTTTSTGTGSTVLNTSPTFVTPILGTPTSGTLTNATGLPLTTGVTGVLPVANGGTNTTTSTGTGSTVLNTSPTFVTPILGTPTSGTLTNATGLPISTGVSGLGANVATALATSSSANWRSAYSDEIGAGPAMFTRTGVRRTFYVPAAAMTPRTTNGPARGTVETTTNDIMYETLDFDTGTEEGSGFWMTMPATWDSGTVTARFHWTATDGSVSETITWNIAGRVFDDGDAIDQALGTEQAAADTLLALSDEHSAATTPAITLAGIAGGTAGPGDEAYFQVTRDVAADNLSADGRLKGVTIEYTESTVEPSAQ